MSLFKDWCDCNDETDKKKVFSKYTEKPKCRNQILIRLGKIVRSHYDNPDHILEDISRLGYPAASEILKALLPKSKIARSGDLGEILASELVEEKYGFTIPVRRMRYKDGREVALRGDDFIGIDNRHGKLRLLKGEAKSRMNLSITTLNSALTSLNRNGGRCTPDSLLFIANRLLESTDINKNKLGRFIRDEVGLRSLKPSNIDHMIFTLSGNVPIKPLKKILARTSNTRNQYVINLNICDHQDFIATVYKEANNLGV
jgi:hypothetical protein